MGATCVHSLSDQRRKIAKPDWDRARVGMICEQAATFADIKTATEQLCQVCNCCTFEVRKQINQFFSSIEAASGKPLPKYQGPMTLMVQPIKKKLERH